LAYFFEKFSLPFTSVNTFFIYFGVKNKSKNSFILNIFFGIFISYYASVIKDLKQNQEFPNMLLQQG